MIVFDHPELLLLLAAAPLYLWALARRRRRSGPRLSLGAFQGAPFSPRHGFRFFLSRARGFLVLLGYSFLVIAAAQPARLAHRLLHLGRGNEIFIVLDLSPSMAAQDLPPSRLDAARSIIEKFVSTRRNETLGLVAFGGEAALVVPPTLDYELLLTRLSELKPGRLGEGTALGAGLATALAHADRSGAPERYLILLTDGENNAGAIAPEEAAKLAALRGFSLSVIGLGRRGEVPISYTDPETGKVRSGTYLSAFDPERLAALARSGGGSYYDAESAEALLAAFTELAERSVSLSRIRSLPREESLALPALLAAFLLLVLARLFGLAAGSELP